MRVITWNVQGVRNKVEQVLKDLGGVDIIALVESWHSDDTVPYFEGYWVENVARKPAKNMRYYGGILLLIKQGRFRKHSRISSVSENIIWVRIHLVSGKSLILGAVYIAPQNSSYVVEVTWDLLEEELRQLRSRFDKDYFLVVGDFNAYTGICKEINQVSFVDTPDLIPDIYKTSRRSKDIERRVNCWGKRLLELCSDNALVIGNGRFGKDGEEGEFTCLSGTNPSVIDYVLVGIELVALTVDVEVLRVVGSDHLPVEIKLCLGRGVPRNKKGDSPTSRVTKDLCFSGKFLKSEWSKEELELMKEEFLRPEIIEKVESLHDETRDIDEILEDLGFVIYECARVSEKPNMKRKNSFFDDECSSFKKELEELLDLVNACSVEEERQSLFLRFKERRREYNRLKRRKKREKIREEQKEIEKAYMVGDTKQFWSGIRQENGQGKGQLQIPEADTWPSFLESIDEDSSGLDSEESRVAPQFPMKEKDYELVKEVTSDEVRKVVKKMKGGSGPGIDGIPAVLLKRFLDVFLLVLVNIFNRIISSGVWPSLWKVSIMVPLFKKGSPSDHDSYRLIALAPALSKILEKILDNRLNEWLEGYGVIKEEQGGFRKGYSTSDRAFVLSALIEKYGSGRKKLYVAFLDLRKAFDNVDRALLEKCLRDVGLPLSFIRLFVGMYSGTKSMVRVAGSGFSRLFDLKKGVKQGSAMSPRLFGLFLNDMVEFLEEKWAPKLCLGKINFSVLLFADDTALVAKSARELQILLDLIEEYLQMKKLQLNVMKTKVVVFSKRNEKIDNIFVFGGQQLEVVEKIKYLGYIFQSNGGWSSHIKEVLNRGRAATFSLFRNKISGIKNLSLHKRVFFI